MTNSLLLMMYPFEDEILTSFRFSPGYDMPDVYSGDAELTQISATINATHYTLIYRCQNCLQWAHGAVTGAASTSAGYMVLGWSQNLVAPGNPSCPSAVTLDQHDNGQGIFGAQLENAPNPSYTDWVELATATVTGTCETSAPTTTSSVPVPTGTTYDYVVVGGGAGGITVADKLSESGASVLLIEKGPPSAARWGGTLGPDWLEGEDLTRFDVPGLCNQIWVDSAGIACSDTDQMTGCVLGGGTAVNAGLWWKVSDTQTPWAESRTPISRSPRAVSTNHAHFSPTLLTGTTTSPMAGRLVTCRLLLSASFRASQGPTLPPWTASDTCRKDSTSSLVGLKLPAGNPWSQTTHRPRRTTRTPIPPTCSPVENAEDQWQRT